jgi:uncharacterized protein (DUF1015 family)
VPILRAFRALRYGARADLSTVLAPPYDIIGPAQRRALLALDDHNIVRVELPADLGSATDADYAAAAGVLGDWQQEGVLVRDAEPTATVHRMRWLEGDGQARAATGLLAQLRLEPFGPGSGVLPHERTLGGPKADRLGLLRATRTNTSPIVFLSGADPAAAAGPLARLTARPPDARARTMDGVDHELWVLPADEAAAALGVLASAPLTIADGHHRYETALGYRDARRAQTGAQEGHAGLSGTVAYGVEAPAWEHVLALVYPLDQAPPVLPTHRVVRGRPCGEDLLERLAPWVAIERLPGREALLARMAEPARFEPGTTGTGRIGLMTGETSVMLTVDQGALEVLLPGGLSSASRGLDVIALSSMVDRAYGDEPGAMADDGRLWYVKDAREATQQVADQAASAAWLLYGMPPEAIAAVAVAGELMPHKSTYFNPKAPTGLVLSPLD